MRKIAVVKPDHIGDLILASPAIAWLRELSSRLVLFVQAQNIPFARFLFPKLELAPIEFAHLHKGEKGRARPLMDTVSPLRDFDFVVFLRSDSVMNRERLRHLLGPCIFSESRDDHHETENQRRSIRPYFGDYDVDRFWVGRRVNFPDSPSVIGLCVGSGFPTNKWSVIKWAEIGRRLIESGKSLRLIGGLQERDEISILARTIGLNATDIIIGDSDIAQFINRVAAADVVIASDGGTGHLCSLVAPVLLVAASVPFRRYAPFGRETRVVSLDLPCSPCINAHHTLINACFSHECSYGILVDHVLEALNAARAEPGTVCELGSGARLFYGISHVH